MDLPTPPQAVAALAAFVRDRLAEVGETIVPLLVRHDDIPVISTLSPSNHRPIDRSMAATARQVATVIIGAAAPFAPTSYSRARLIRQMHASGLLSGDEARRAAVVLDLDPSPGHAPDSVGRRLRAAPSDDLASSVRSPARHADEGDPATCPC